MVEYVLFDLDGTITNPKEGIINSFIYSLNSMNIIIEDPETLTRHIGPPLRESFMENHGLSEEETEAAIEKYREYFKETGIFENQVYKGMENLLVKLKEAGKIIIMATSKPETYAKKIMDYFHLTGYFDDICGATFDSSMTCKEDIIRYALERNNITQMSGVVMVGDRKYDVEGAKALGIYSIGVLYGFGSRQELIDAGADEIVNTVDELWEVIMNF